jgi:hypothetical protein
MILIRGDIEKPSDLEGIEYYAYNDMPSEKENEIKSFIESLRKQSSLLTSALS